MMLPKNVDLNQFHGVNKISDVYRVCSKDGLIPVKVDTKDALNVVVL